MNKRIFSSPIKCSIILPAIVILVISTGPVWADEAPGNYSVIQNSLPDSVSLKDKVVYIDFWASWCVPCRKSFPWMQEMYDKYKSKGFIIIAVNVDKKQGSAKKFLENNKASFPIIFDSTGSLAESYSLEAMPSSYIYSRDGKLSSMHLGFLEDEMDNLEDQIIELLHRER